MPLDLVAIARRAMTERGFAVDFPPTAEAEIARASAAVEGTLATLPPGVRDLRSLLWSSIDNRESRDLDQIELAEVTAEGAIRIRVGVADVDVLVQKGSALDLRAGLNTTSVYTGVVVFPMLPERLSTDLTSLNQDADRFAVVMDFVVKADGSLGDSDVYRARVRNQAQLSYDELGAFLAGKAPAPERVTRHPGLEAQLRLQDTAAQRLRALREEHGALQFETAEVQTVAKDGQVVGLELTPKLRSRELIEDFMIAANGVMARFLEAHGRASIARVVRTPKRWSRIVELAAAVGEGLPDAPDSRALAAFLSRRRETDPAHFADLSLAVVKLLGPGEYDLHAPNTPPLGHFGLAVPDYTHSTAPNRRYGDLVTQRLLKAALANAPAPYTSAELTAIAARCTLKESDERKVERTMRKVVAAQLLHPRVGEVFDAIVTGAVEKGTFVRLTSPPAEGRVIRGEQGMDVGAHVRVRLVSTDPEKGFIDFVRV